MSKAGVIASITDQQGEKKPLYSAVALLISVEYMELDKLRLDADTYSRDFGLP